jgi:CRP/FNR family cyclic AMP-dependent transcriptional regulator
VQQLVRRLRDAEEQIENMLHARQPVEGRQRAAASSPARAAAPVGEARRFTVSPLELSSRARASTSTPSSARDLQLREGQYIRIVEERVVIDDLDALRRLFSLLGMKEQLRG